MGSYANSNSTTNYKNTPLTLGNGDNPLGVAGSDGTQIGGSGNVSGSSNLGNTNLGPRASLVSNSTTLDGGAISQAFNFASNTFGILQDVINSNKDAHDHISGTATEAVAAHNTAMAAPTTTTATTSDNSKYIVWLGLGALAYFAWKAFK